MSEISNQLSINCTVISYDIQSTISQISLNGVINVGSFDKYQTVKYDGNYIVTPKTEEQILSTKNTILNNDVTIKSIPYYQVSNLYDGITVTIGG